MTNYYNSKGRYKTREFNTKTKACQLWENIKNRCEYLPIRDESRFGKYADVDSCKEWKDFQNFAEWFESVKESGYYSDGWQLDKDLLVKDNKIYSPEFCVFLPEEVNKALNTKSRNRGNLPIGMYYRSNRSGRVIVRFTCKYPEFAMSAEISESQILDGFALYKKAREAYLRFLAEKYKDSLDPRAYEALIKYEVRIDD